MSEYPHLGTSFLSIKKNKVIVVQRRRKAKQNQVISGIHTFNELIENWYYTMKRNCRNLEWQRCMQ